MYGYTQALPRAGTANCKKHLDPNKLRFATGALGCCPSFSSRRRRICFELYTELVLFRLLVSEFGSGVSGVKFAV